MEFDDLSNIVIGCAIEVHRRLGPGLLESAYEHCLAHELIRSGIECQSQVPLPIRYRDVQLDCGYRVDILVKGQLIIELKCVAALKAIHQAQLMTYMKLAEVPVGLLLNFNVSVLRDGIKRFVL